MLSQRLARIQGVMASQELSPVTIPFAGWQPDRADYANPGSTEALNVVPTPDGFRPLPDLVTQSDALTARCQGAAAAKDTSGNVSFYAGDVSKLYRLVGGAFQDASGATYTTAADDVWEFAQFGQTALATNYADAVQSVAVGGATFADHFTSTLKPKARHIAVIRDNLFIGNTNDTENGVKPNRVQWSAINDSTDMDPSASTQADFQDIPDGGWIQKIVGGVEYGLIYQESSIKRAQYVGSPLIYQFDPIDRARGTPIPQSVIALGRMVFSIAEEGFMMCDGLQNVPIGHGAVDRTFWAQFDLTNASRVSAAIDPINSVVMWAFPGSGNVGGSPNKLFFYNYKDQKWSEGEVDVQVLLRTFKQGYTLDGLDAVGTDIDADPPFSFSFDSKYWTGGNIQLAAFDTSNKLAFFEGDNLAATLETSEFQPNARGRSEITAVRPLIDGGTITAAIASRALLTATATFGSAASINTNGECTITSEGRYHRVRNSIAAGGTWTHAQGVVVNASKTGEQ